MKSAAGKLIAGIRLARAVQDLVSYLALSVITVVMGFPIFWMLSTALKSESQANRFPP